MISCRFTVPRTCIQSMISANYTINCKNVLSFFFSKRLVLQWHLDSLCLQDIVTESSSFDLVSFIPLLRDRIYTANPFAKQFLVSWVSVWSIDEKRYLKMNLNFEESEMKSLLTFIVCCLVSVGGFRCCTRPWSYCTPSRIPRWAVHNLQGSQCRD